MHFFLKNGKVWAISFLIVSLVGCGYSTRSLLPSRIRTIYVEPFKNKIDYTTERKRDLYIPLLEVKITNAVIDRFLFDGHLKVADRDQADVILKGELVNYDRDALRYTDNNDVEEYRINITVNLVLWDVAKDKPLWQEKNFVGDTTYFTRGPHAESETIAVTEAVEDLAKRVVERTIENW